MDNVIKRLAENNFVLPNFKKSNFQIMDDIANGRTSKLIGDKRNKILMLVDGFGLNMLDRLQSKNKGAKDTIAKASLDSITTLFPSATLCVLSSLFSGMLPSEHGVIGDILTVKGFGLVNIMNLSRLFDDKDNKIEGLGNDMIYPKNYNIQRLKASNAIGIFPESIKKFSSGKQILNDLPSIEYQNIENLQAVMEKVVKSGKYGNMLVYYGHLDYTEHMHGFLSEESIVEASKVVKLLEGLRTTVQNSDYNLVVTADHGHIVVKDQEFKAFGSTSKLARQLELPPWGNPRTLFLKSKDGKDESLERAFEEEFGEYGEIFRSEDMLKAGIFGPVKPTMDKMENFGSHVVVSKGSYSINYTSGGLYEPWFDRFKGQVGTHGGMTAEEMQVPLIVF